MSSTSASEINAKLRQKIEKLCFEKDLTSSIVEISGSDSYDLFKFIIDEVNSNSDSCSSSSSCLDLEHLLFATRIICSKCPHIGPVVNKVHDLLVTALEVSYSSKSFSTSRVVRLFELLSVFLDFAPINDCSSLTDSTLVHLKKKAKFPIWFPHPSKVTAMQKDESILLASINTFSKYVCHPSHVENYNNNNSSVSSSTNSSSATSSPLPSCNLDPLEIKCLAGLYKYVTSDNSSSSGSSNALYTAAISAAVFNAFLFLARSSRGSSNFLIGKEFCKWFHAQFFSAPSVLEAFIKWLEVSGRGDAKLCGEIISFGFRICFGLGGTIVGNQYQYSNSYLTTNANENNFIEEGNILVRLILQQTMQSAGGGSNFANNNNNNGAATSVIASSSSSSSSVTSPTLNYSAPLCSLSGPQALVETPLFIRSVFVHAASCQMMRILANFFSTNNNTSTSKTSNLIIPANSFLRDSIAADSGMFQSSSNNKKSNNANKSSSSSSSSFFSLRSLLLSLIINSTTSSLPLSADQVPYLVGVQCLELVFSALGCDGKISTLVALLASLISSSLRQIAADNCGVASADDLGPGLTLVPQNQNQNNNNNKLAANSPAQLLSVRTAAILFIMQKGISRMSTVTDTTLALTLTTVKFLLNNSSAPISEIEIRTAVVLLLELCTRLPRPFPVTGQRKSWGLIFEILANFVDAPLLLHQQNNNNNQNSTNSSISNLHTLPLVSKRISSIVCAIRTFQAAASESDDGSATSDFAYTTMNGNNNENNFSTQNNNNNFDDAADLSSSSSHGTTFDVKRKVVKVFYDFISQKAFQTLCHLQSPMSAGIPAAAISAALWYRADYDQQQEKEQQENQKNNSNINVNNNNNNNSSFGIKQWWDQAVEFVCVATNSPLPASLNSKQQIQQQQNNNNNNQPLSMSTMRSALAIIHESWQAKFLEQKQQQQQQKQSPTQAPSSSSSSSSFQNNNNNFNAVSTSIITNSGWVQALTVLISDNKAPISVRADALGMFSQLPAQFYSTHFRQISPALGQILLSSFSCASSVVKEIGENPLLSHSSCWSVLPQCCSTVRIDGYAVVQRSAPRIHARGLLPCASLDSQQQLVTSAIATLSKAVRVLPATFFRDIISLHFEVFAKLASNTPVSAGGTMNANINNNNNGTNGSNSSGNQSSSNGNNPNATAVGLVVGGSSVQIMPMPTSTSATQQQLLLQQQQTLYHQNPFISSVNRSTVLLNTLSSLIGVLRSYSEAMIFDERNNNNSNSVNSSLLLLDKATLGLLLDQFLSRSPAPLLVPSSLSHSTDLAVCILSSRCVAILSSLVPDISAKIVQQHVPAIFAGLVLKESSSYLAMLSERSSLSNNSNNKNNSASPSTSSLSPQQDQLLAMIVSVSSSILSQQWTNPWSPFTPMPVVAALHSLLECISDQSIESLLGASVQGIVNILLKSSTTASTTASSSSNSIESSSPSNVSMNSSTASLVCQLLLAAFENQWISFQQQQSPQLKKLTQALLSCAFVKPVSPIHGSTSSELLQKSLASDAMDLFTKMIPNSLIFDYVCTFWHHPSTQLGNNSASVFKCIERAKRRIGIAVVNGVSSSTSSSSSSQLPIIAKKRRINFLLSLIASEPSRGTRNSLNASLDLLLCRLCGGEANSDTVKILESLKDILRMRPSKILATSSSPSSGSSNSTGGINITFTNDANLVILISDADLKKSGGTSTQNNGNNNNNSNTSNSTSPQRDGDNKSNDKDGKNDISYKDGEENNNNDDDEQQQEEKTSRNASNSNKQPNSPSNLSNVDSDEMYPGVAEFSTKLALYRSFFRLLQIVGSSKTSMEAWWGSEEKNPKLFTFMNRLVGDLSDSLIATITSNSTTSFFLIPYLNALLSSSSSNSSSTSSSHQYFPSSVTERMFLDSAIPITTAIRKIIEDGPATSSSSPSFNELFVGKNSQLMKNLDSSNFSKIMASLGNWAGYCWRGTDFFAKSIISKNNVNSPASSSFYFPKREVETMAIDNLILMLNLSKKSQSQQQPSSVDAAFSAYLMINNNNSNQQNQSQNYFESFWNLISEVLTKDLFFYVLSSAKHDTNNNNNFSSNNNNKKQNNSEAERQIRVASFSKKLLAQVASSSSSSSSIAKTGTSEMKNTSFDFMNSHQNNNNNSKRHQRHPSSNKLTEDELMHHFNSNNNKNDDDDDDEISSTDEDKTSTHTSNQSPTIFPSSVSQNRSPSEAASKIRKNKNVSSSKNNKGTASNNGNSDHHHHHHHHFYSLRSTSDQNNQNKVHQTLRLHFLRHRILSSSGISILEFCIDFLDMFRKCKGLLITTAAASQNNSNTKSTTAMSRTVTAFFVSLCAFVLGDEHIHHGLIHVPKTENLFFVHDSNDSNTATAHSSSTLLSQSTAALCAIAATLQPDSSVLKTSGEVLLQIITNDVIPGWIATASSSSEGRNQDANSFRNSTKFLSLSIAILWHLLLACEVAAKNLNFSEGVDNINIESLSSLQTVHDAMKQVASTLSTLVNLLEVTENFNLQHQQKQPNNNNGIINVGVGIVKVTLQFLERSGKSFSLSSQVLSKSIGLMLQDENGEENVGNSDDDEESENTREGKNLRELLESTQSLNDEAFYLVLECLGKLGNLLPANQQDQSTTLQMWFHEGSKTVSQWKPQQRNDVSGDDEDLLSQFLMSSATNQKNDGEEMDDPLLSKNLPLLMIALASTPNNENDQQNEIIASECIKIVEAKISSNDDEDSIMNFADALATTVSSSSGFNSQKLIFGICTSVMSRIKCISSEQETNNNSKLFAVTSWCVRFIMRILHSSITTTQTNQTDANSNEVMMINYLSTVAFLMNLVAKVSNNNSDNNNFYSKNMQVLKNAFNFVAQNYRDEVRNLLSGNGGIAMSTITTLRNAMSTNNNNEQRSNNNGNNNQTASGMGQVQNQSNGNNAGSAPATGLRISLANWT